MLRPSQRHSEAPALCEKAGDDPANIEWTRKAWEDMKRFSTGGNYVNFFTEDETPERRLQARSGCPSLS